MRLTLPEEIATQQIATEAPDQIEAELAQRIRDEGCIESRNALVERNMGLVRAIAREFTHMGARYDDLVAEGNMALLRAADRFDPERGVRFGSYAATWIRHAMRSVRSGNARPVHVPTRMLRELRSLVAARSELAETLDRTPTIAELSEHTGLSKAHIRDLIERLDLLEPIRTIDPAHCAVTEKTPSADSFDFDDAPTDADRLRVLVAKLPVQEREVISRCFGLNDAEPMTLRAVAESMELNAAAVRKILRNGMIRLRNSAAA